MSYIDEGEGPALVCIHGNPSWSYLYRHVVSEFSGSYRCIVPDHIGCGFSDKPKRYSYRLATHIENLSSLLQTLEIDTCTVMVHDWGGAIGMGWAGKYPERVKGIVVLNTAAFPSKRLPFRIAICRVPLLGALLVRGLNGFAGAAIFMAVVKKMKPETAEGFLAPYGSWRSRIAILRFVQDIPMNDRHPSWDTLLGVEKSLQKLRQHPVLICWGGRDFCFTKHFYEEWRTRFPLAQAHFFAHAGHYVLEDARKHVFPLLSTFFEQVHAT